MPDEFKKFFRHELNELKENKIRAGTLVVLFFVTAIVFVLDDDSGGEEIILNEPKKISDAPATKDLPAANLPEKNSADGVTLVLGANADPIFVSDPFAGEKKISPPKKIVQPPSTPQLPPIIPQPPFTPPKISEQTKPTEKIILTGTASSGGKKLAMFLCGKETIFLTLGEEIGGKKISDITADFVAFEDGTRVFLQKELR